MSDTRRFTISKLDSARRQLETAVYLYFKNGDEVSIHTLTAAAYNILRGLSSAHGKTEMFVKDRFFEWVKPGMEKLVRDKLNEAENFFKHADKDPEGLLEFAPFQTEVFLLDACSQYQTITGEVFPVFKLYELWFLLHNTTAFNLPPEAEALVHSLGPELVSQPRPKFLQELLPLMLSQRA
jgi:hypothetical protein